MVYELKIWFRFVVNGEQEKDFEYYEMEALNIHEAFKFIKQKYFKTNSRIPISYERIINNASDGKVYKPFNIDLKDSAFENPISNLENKY